MFSGFTYSAVSALFLLLYSAGLFPLTIFFLMESESILLEWVIFQVSSCSVSFMVVLDMVSLSFSNVVCLISGCVMMFSCSYMSDDLFLKRFTWLVMLFVLSMNMLIFIPSLPALLLGWDGLGIVSFALVIYYQNVKSLGAGMLTVLANRAGDVMILLSIGVLVLQGHWIILLMWDFSLSAWVVGTIVIAAMTKSAQIPFSSWLPAAMAAPTPVSALVHSSTLVTAGVYLIIRFYNFLCISSLFKPFLLFVSLLTLLMAGLSANYENDLKKVIALSTLSQLGVMMMSLSMNMVYLSLYHLYTHALFKALLFLCAGAIIHSSSDMQDIRSMGFISYQAPLVTACMNVANLSLCGAPFLSGFYSKDLILEVSLVSPTSFLVILLFFLATGMTVAYSVRLSFSVLWGLMKGYSYHAKGESDLMINWSMSILSVAAIVGGLYLQAVFLEFSPCPLVMPVLHKYLTIFTLLTGVFVSVIIWHLDFSSKAMSKTGFFLTTMWFLALISSQPLTKFSMVVGTNLMKSVDQGWFEVVGGQGVNLVLTDIFQKNQTVQTKFFNFFISLIIMSLLVVILGTFLI